MTVKIFDRQVCFQKLAGAVNNFRGRPRVVSKMSFNCCVQQEPEILETVDRVDEAVDGVDEAVEAKSL